MLTGRWLALAFCAALASGCASVTNPNAAPPVQALPEPVPAPTLPPQPEPVPASAPEPVIIAAPEPAQMRNYELQDWAALPDWNNDNLAQALPAFLLSCNVLKAAADWVPACTGAAQVRKDDPMSARQFFESAFAPWLVHNADGTTEGLVTGYYEPLLHGSRIFGRSYRFPIYGVPPDLLVIDLAESNPELKGIRLRGRMQDRKIVPYYTRAEIERGLAPVRGREILWVDDPVELFFLHVQGSGRVRLPGGETVRVGFA